MTRKGDSWAKRKINNKNLCIFFRASKKYQMSASEGGENAGVKKKIKKKKKTIDADAYSEADRNSNEEKNVAKSQDNIRESRNSEMEKNFVKSDLFAKNLALFIQEQLSNATKQFDSDTSGDGSSEVSIPRGKSFSILSTVAATAEPRVSLRHSNELPAQTNSLLKTAVLNSSPRRDVAQNNTTATPTSLATSSTTTRSTDSSPRATTSSAESSPFTSPRDGTIASVRANATNMVLTPPSTRMSSGRSLFDKFNRRGASASRPVVLNSRQKTAVSAKQFLANDFLANNNTVPQICNDMHILQCEGGGGAAKIYKAEIRNAIFAVKIYNTYFALSEENRERQEWVRKIQFIGSLDHPNIVRVLGYRFEIHNNGSRLLIVMPYIPNTLDGLILKRRALYYRSNNAVAATELKQPPFQQAEIVGLLKQIVSAVAYLHRIDVLHRDLKCTNVLAQRCDYIGGIDRVLDETMTPRDKTFSFPASFQEDSSEVTAESNADDDNDRFNFGTELHTYYELLLTDLDDAKKQIQLSASSSSSSSRSTPDFSKKRTDGSHGNARGDGLRSESDKRHRDSLNVTTLAFAAPEMIVNPESIYGKGVDIWSIGMILYNMLMLESPYSLENYGFELPDRIGSGTRPKLIPGYINTSAWTEMYKLFLGCTETNAQNRPDATVLLNKLENM